MEKFFICKKGWARHSKGTIITEWEYNKLATESKLQFFESYSYPEVKSELIVEATPFEENLVKELEDKGIKAKFKHKVEDGKPSLDATFTFDKPE
jgi:hypothetical protein